jgi:hypothetical protein
MNFNKGLTINYKKAMYLLIGILKYEDTSEYPRSGALKLTPEGYKLYKEVNPMPMIPSNDPVLNDDILEVGVLSISQDTLVPVSSQTHLVVIHDYNTDTLRAIGILTSEDTANTNLLSETQPISGNDNKEQFFRAFPVPYEVNPSDFIKHEKGTKYIQESSITKKVNDIIKSDPILTPIPYNSKGTTKTDLIRMIELKKQLDENTKADEALKASKPMNSLQRIS